jgi:hypothetical protein
MGIVEPLEIFHYPAHCRSHVLKGANLTEIGQSW